MQPFAKKGEMSTQLPRSCVSPRPQHAITVGIRGQQDLFDVERRRFPQLSRGIPRPLGGRFDGALIIGDDAQQQGHAFRQGGALEASTARRRHEQVKRGPHRPNVLIGRRLRHRSASLRDRRFVGLVAGFGRIAIAMVKQLRLSVSIPIPIPIPIPISISIMTLGGELVEDEAQRDDARLRQPLEAVAKLRDSRLAGGDDEQRAFHHIGEHERVGHSHDRRRVNDNQIEDFAGHGQQRGEMWAMQQLHRVGRQRTGGHPIKIKLWVNFSNRVLNRAVMRQISA